VAYLTALGHFDAAPKSLTWRQKLWVVLQALDALLYLHTRTPRVLHRDFKPANILLDASLCAQLGDTGFAKAAQRSGDVSQLGGATTGRVMGSPGYAHPDVLSSQYSEITEGFAVGRTLLVVLTRRKPVDIEDEIEDDNGDLPFGEVPAAQMADPGAGWPVEVATEIKRLYVGLCVVRKKHQLKLVEVQRALQALLQSAPQAGEAWQGDAQSTVENAVAAGSSLPAPSPLSLQVRNMRHSDRSHDSVQRNVSEAFQSFIRRLDALYQSERAARAPSDFKDRIDFWRDACGLPANVHASMQRLRIWRNASEHQDEQRWLREGPRSAEAVSTHIAALDAHLRELESDP
jgi:serine/threonine protein kinase